MISSYLLQDSTASMADAERADLMEALLRGELSREDYEEILVLTNKKTNRDEKGK